MHLHEKKNSVLKSASDSNLQMELKNIIQVKCNV